MTAQLPVSGNTQLTKPENKAFFPALDGLRALAFFLVFGHHYFDLPCGWAGVNIFFVLSGFLITGILYDTRDDPHRTRNFYVRRTLRIFPLYYAVLILLVALWPFAHWEWNWKWLSWAAYLGNWMHFSPMPSGSPAELLGDFQLTGLFHHRPFKLFLGHFWSLCIEEQFYLIWPAIVFFVHDRRKLLWICGLALPVCLLLRIAAECTLPSWMLEENVLSRFTPLSCDSLLAGGFIALLFRGPNRQLMFKVAAWCLLPALCGCVLWAGIHFRHSFDAPVSRAWTETLGFTVVDVLGMLLILQAIQTDNWVYTLFKLRPLRWAGRISYGTYLIHDIPHMLLWHLALPHRHPRVISGALAIVWTYPGAWLCFRFLETPFLNLKERWTVRA